MDRLSLQPYGREDRGAARRIYRRTVHCPLISFRTGVTPCHIRVDAAFIQKYQDIYVSLRYMFFPCFPFGPDIGDAPVLKRGGTSFYKRIRVSGLL